MIPVNDTDKSTWQTVRFGAMVHHISERVQPDEVTVDRYVGLGHLDPESLKIRRWGSPDEVGATKLRFYPGDIIFGKRRFYQRKLAVADFEGICSAHAMVLRAKADVVLPEFLPFFMQSETFFERAMSISVGSLSPTINWSTLQRQEFALPPLAEQKRIAEVFWAQETANEKWQKCLVEQEITKRAVMNQLFQQEVKDTLPLGNIGTWMSGGTPSRQNQKFWSGSIPWASPKDMKVDILHDTEEHVSQAGADSGSRTVPKDTIFIVIRGMILAHTFPVAITGREMTFNQDMKALVTNERFLPKYIFLLVTK